MRVTSVSCGVFHTAAVAVPRTCVQADERTPPGSPVPISAHDLLNQPAAAAAAFTAASLPEVPRDLNWGPFGAGGRAEGREKRHTPLLLCVPVSRGHNPMTAYSCGTNASDSTDTPITPATGKKGVVYTWGSNDRGCLGRGEEGQDDVGLLPGPVGGELEGLDVQKVACGYHLTAALTKCGRVFQWGSTGTAFSDSAPWTRCNEPKQVQPGDAATCLSMLMCFHALGFYAGLP